MTPGKEAEEGVSIGWFVVWSPEARYQPFASSITPADVNEPRGPWRIL